MTPSEQGPEGPLHAVAELAVARNTVVAEGVVELELQDPSGRELPSWDPGAHIDLAPLPGLIRQYSLCGDPRDSRRWQVAVLRDEAGRGGSVAAHMLSVGDKVAAGGPRNHFKLVPADHYLFIAGGIGITPIAAMIRAVGSKNADWRLVYGGRTRSSMAYVDELIEFGGDRVAILPQDKHGLLDLPQILADVDPGCHLYACGPTSLLDAIVDQTAAWHPDHVHMERFAPVTSTSETPDLPVHVVLEQSGIELDVRADQSILDAVLDAGIDVPSSCSEGTCGSCEVPVTGGTPDHRDSVLSSAEREANATMMICVSRARTDELRLDI